MKYLRSLAALVLLLLVAMASPAAAQEQPSTTTTPADLAELSDSDLYRRALSAIATEQAMLPTNGPERGAAPPPPNPQLREADLASEHVLDALNARALEIPDSARLVLNLMPQRGSGVPGPKPVQYEAARRELGVIADRVAEAEAAPTGFGRFASAALVVVGLAAAAAAGMWVRGRKQRGLATLAMTDGLTGLKNRRQLDVDLANQRRNGSSQTALLMIDIDHFKAFNDRHGHATGDEVLRQVASAIAASVRNDDVPYRYGGEEFCVLLPGTDDVAAHVVADRVRQAIERIDVDVSAVTASVGVASGAASDLDSIASEADRALYCAKSAGRNRVVSASSPSA